MRRRRSKDHNVAYLSKWVGTFYHILISCITLDNVGRSFSHITHSAGTYICLFFILLLTNTSCSDSTSCGWLKVIPSLWRSQTTRKMIKACSFKPWAFTLYLCSIWTKTTSKTSSNSDILPLLHWLGQHLLTLHVPGELQHWVNSR